MNNEIKSFEGKHIRSVWDNEKEEWLFCVVDVVAALTESENPQVYWRVLKKRLKKATAWSKKNTITIRRKRF